jgi:DNA-binding transcriptional ArsR family regulator
VTNQEIRRKILETLYESFKDHPYGRITPKELQEMLNISLKELHFNAIYLEEKGLIELQKPLEGNLFVGARATPKGIDIVEDEYQLDIFFPTDQTTGVVPTCVLDDLKILINKVDNSTELNAEQKEMITEEIKEVLTELKKSEPSYSLLKKTLDRLKERSTETYEELIAILKDPAVTRILSIAARKELGI